LLSPSAVLPVPQKLTSTRLTVLAWKPWVDRASTQRQSANLQACAWRSTAAAGLQASWLASASAWAACQLIPLRFSASRRNAAGPAAPGAG
jgi:hypothetical protein